MVSGEGYIDFTISNLSLLEGTYLFSAAIYDQNGIHPYDHHSMAYTLRVIGQAGIPEEHGVVQLRGHWNLSQSPAMLADTNIDDRSL